ncbi:uncharacterized protein CANTADRAFT_143294 [Suhomyces tanzawaensis NRRL Y-17324]|uniref:Uncharacterized protein n=1 Tax=Suhomyces tanzawaensis NRRL Y-17324 TaxID=984487 RepID=A0A1E4SS76_9ASCO|nr:uncharacterized protein CANTADRAFT_143294 [Suhomyces tanzawaensis NRRL Y-17324]ODV82366.1 hypothetical protein CANTADRAFT_143294 [Suhomyces tanzawaensis NRRL Y-17324]
MPFHYYSMEYFTIVAMITNSQKDRGLSLSRQICSKFFSTHNKTIALRGRQKVFLAKFHEEIV